MFAAFACMLAAFTVRCPFLDLLKHSMNTPDQPTSKSTSITGGLEEQVKISDVMYDVYNVYKYTTSQKELNTFQNSSFYV